MGRVRPDDRHPRNAPQRISGAVKIRAPVAIPDATQASFRMTSAKIVATDPYFTHSAPIQEGISEPCWIRRYCEHNLLPICTCGKTSNSVMPSQIYNR